MAITRVSPAAGKVSVSSRITGVVETSRDHVPEAVELSPSRPT